jgi:hypothetical protein
MMVTHGALRFIIDIILQGIIAMVEGAPYLLGLGKRWSCSLLGPMLFSFGGSLLVMMDRME